MLFSIGTRWARACEIRPVTAWVSALVDRTPRRRPGWVAPFLVAALAAGAEGQSLLWQAYGTAPLDGFGQWVARTGDVTGDGAGDLLVPVPFATVNGLSNAGLVKVFSGADGSLVYTVTDTPPIQGGVFGWSRGAAGLGDLNGDGLSEFIVRAASTMTVFSGGDALPLYAYALVPFLGASGQASLGDVDGDGVPDFGFRNQTAAPPYFDVEVRSGATGSLISTVVQYSSGNPYTLAGVGDVDGDGLLDLAIGSPDDFFGYYGQVEVYTALTGQLLLTAVGLYGAGFGVSLAGGGDVDGDGLSDVVFGVGGSGFNNYCGAHARVVGGPGLTYLWDYLEIEPCDETGWAVDGGFDLDGDGFDDPIVGSRRYGAFTLPYSDTGALRIFSGQSGAALLQLTGWPGATGSNSSLGTSVAYLGDVTGDDFPDFAVGADSVNGINCGSVPGGGFSCSGGVRAYSGAPPGVVAFGAGCPGSSGAAPRIGATWKPSLGSTWSVNLSKTVPNVPALLLLGFNNTQWWGLPLPFDLATLGMPGCPLLVSPDFIFPASTSGNPAAGGRAKVTFAVPSAPTLAGASVYVQWYVADPAAATPGGAVTRGLAITLQP